MNGKQRLTAVAAGVLALLALGAMLLLLSASSIAASQTRYVASTGTDAQNDCLDSNNPCATIQHAIGQANAGDEIRVAQGTYTDLHVTGGMTAVIQIDKPLTIRGGYTTADWVTAYPLTQPTIIDPRTQGRGIIVAPAITVTLEGLRITNGVANRWGGGVLGKTGAHLIITGCWIYKNRSEQHSGGIHIYSGTLTLSNSYVYLNTAVLDGGGINLSHSGGILRGNFIHHNLVEHYSAGGVYLNYSPWAVLEDNHIYENVAGYHGGGVYSWYSTDAELLNNRIYGNSVAHYGGGIYLYHSEDFTLEGNYVYDNESLSAGGGIFVGWGKHITMTNNVVAGNTISSPAGKAAAIWLNWSDVHLVHNTIAANKGGDGSGIMVETLSTLRMTNTVLVSHTVGITVAPGCTATLEGTLWGQGEWANGTDWGGGGTVLIGTVNIWGDPAFVDPANDDYHIGSGSAAINAGIDAGVSTDIDGDPRPLGSAPDLGVDEFKAKVYLPLMMKHWQSV